MHAFQSAKSLASKTSSAKATYKCACCGSPFEARTADRARGWAKFCSKRCKAIKQEQRTGQFAQRLRAQGEWI